MTAGNGHPAHEPKSNEPATAETPHPVTIVLTFPPNGLDVSVKADGVSPAQLYLAAWYLDAVAREVRAGQVARSALGGIVTNPQGILDELRRTGRV